MISVIVPILKIYLVIRKGEEGECMFIIYQGEVNIIAGEEDKITTTLNEMHVFGERALETNELRTATIVAKTPKVILLSFSKTDYKIVLYVKKSIL